MLGLSCGKKASFGSTDCFSKLLLKIFHGYKKATQYGCARMKTTCLVETIFEYLQKFPNFFTIIFVKRQDVILKC